MRVRGCLHPYRVSATQAGKKRGPKLGWVIFLIWHVLLLARPLVDVEVSPGGGLRPARPCVARHHHSHQQYLGTVTVRCFLASP